MPTDGVAHGKGRRWLLWLGVVLVVVGAALMDVAGRTRLAIWWDVSGACALAGFLLAGYYLVVTEGWSVFDLKTPARPSKPADLAPRDRLPR